MATFFEQTPGVVPLSPRTGDEQPEPSALGLVNVMLRYRYSIIGIAAVIAVLVVGAGLLEKRTFTSVSAITPQANRGGGQNISGIAAQFGLNVGSSDVSQSPNFYADLLQSREILDSAVASTYEFTSDTGRVRGTLIDIYGFRKGSPAQRQDAAVRELSSRLVPSVTQKTGIVRVNVSASHPALAQQVNARLLALINQFNLVSRQTQAAAERRFAEQRLAEVKQDLRQAEDRLLTFLKSNRDARSPELSFEQDRLTRVAQQQQLLYGTLQQAYEQAKIDEVRDTPVITVIEHSSLPIRPDSRGLAQRGFLAVIIGLVVGIALAFAREFAHNARTVDSGSIAVFSRLIGEARTDLRHPIRALSRRRSSEPPSATR